MNYLKSSLMMATILAAGTTASAEQNAIVTRQKEDSLQS